MHFNYYFLKWLSDELNNKLKGAIFRQCYSQNKNELIIEFELPNQETFYIKVHLESELPLVYFPIDIARARKNSVDLFQEIKGKEVHDVQQYTNERAYSINCGDFQLVFKLYGKMANILLAKGDQIISIFKNNLSGDLNIIPSQLDRSIDQNIELVRKSGFDLKGHFPTFDKSMYNYLERFGLDTDQESALSSLLQQLNELNCYLYLDHEEKPHLTLLKPEDSSYESFEDPLMACNALAKSYFSIYLQQQQKKKLIQRLEQEIKRTQNYIQKTNTKLEGLINARGYDELANILMANLHQITATDQRQIELLDFYTNEYIKIKINPKLSLQRNAENYYRKAKNQSKETEKLEDNLNEKRIQLNDLQKKLDLARETTDRKEIKKLTEEIQKTQKSQKEDLPYYHLHVQGHEVLIGKNAKYNDVLTLKIAKKNDLWLHAKDVPGSHVVIKSNGSDQYPKDLIETVAQLAAWYSKRKHDTLCPVLYTLKKYVNKPKGFAPGMMRVLREEVVMVKPKRSI